MLRAMARRPYVPDELTHGPFRRADAVALGVSARQLRSYGFRRVCHDVYVSAAAPDDPALRLAAVRLVAPPHAVVSGVSAAWLLGCDVRRSTAEPIEVTAPRGVTFSNRRGLLRPRQALVPDDDVVEVGGVRVTSPLRTAFDLARWPDLAEGVVAVDAMWRAGLVEPEALAAYAAEHRGWRGVRQVPRVVDLADRRSEGPMESRLRMVLVVRGGLPRPQVQLEIVVDGHVVARLDLAYEECLLDVEFDGSGHRTSEPVWARDRRRNHDLVGLGWSTLAFDADDVYRRPAYVCGQVARFLRRAA